MPGSHPGTIGILPAGALGVSFFFHLTRGLRECDGKIFFLERAGSKSAAALHDGGTLHIATSEVTTNLPATALFKGNLLQCYREDSLPEVLLVCPNPDQLLAVMTTIVELIELISADDRLAALPLPIIVLSANGIYFQRVRQLFIEKLEEATLFGRLPDLWPELMPRIIGRLLRGITIQTGIREGFGSAAVYRPGERGITRLAGGDQSHRERCCRLLSGRGGWFELAANSSATRLEFEKAQVNLVANLLGQLYAIDEGGRFRSLTVDDIVVPEHEAEIRDLARHVFEVGRAVKAYGPQESFDTVFATLLDTFRMHRSHVPSSLQWVGLLLRQGTLKAELTPTESWILEPLNRYARSAGLEEGAIYFENLKIRLIARLRDAIRAGRGEMRPDDGKSD